MYRSLQKRKEKVRRCTYQSIKEVNEDKDGNRNLFLKEAIKGNRRKVGSCNIIKGENGRLVLGENEVRMI